MKKIIFLLPLFLCFCLSKANCQTITEKDWEKVMVTRNPDDVKGMTRVSEVSAEASRLYGKQSKLRSIATERIKKAAAKLGANVVLIQVDNFGMSPVNNVNLLGVAYKSGQENLPAPTKSADAGQDKAVKTASAEAKKDVPHQAESSSENYFEKNQHYINLGLGFANTVGPVAGYAGYEYAVSDQFGIGGTVGIGYKSIPYNGWYGIQSVSVLYFIIGPKASWHFTNAMKNVSPKLDGYVSGMVGYNMASASDGYNELAESAVALQLSLGLKYAVSKNIALYGELGYGVSIINLGVNFKI